MTQRIERTTVIQAHPNVVWSTLTDAALMKQWMGEPEMQMEIATDWKVGNPIVIRGFHHVKFENKGTILEFEPDNVLKYDYLSSISRLPDRPENRTIIEFRLSPVENHTSLTLIVSNFPTESIFRHVDFYWKTTMEILKKFIERQ